MEGSLDFIPNAMGSVRASEWRDALHLTALRVTDGVAQCEHIREAVAESRDTRVASVKMERSKRTWDTCWN